MISRCQVILFSTISIVVLRVGSAQSWTVEQILKPSDGRGADNFGWSLAMDKDVIAVGAPKDDINGTSNQGSVYVFERDNGNRWVETTKVTTPWCDYETEYFGYSVVIQGGTIVAGARLVDIHGAIGGGQAYVYAKNATTGDWDEVQRLSNPLAQPNAHFGDAMAIHDRTLVIGEPGTNNYEGAVHVFIRPNEEWVLQTVLYPPRVFGTQEEFGTSVDIHGDWAVVGAKQVEELDELPGYAMIFHRDPHGVWDEGFVIQPDESSNGDEFGRSVTIQGDLVVVARKSDSFVFKRTGTAGNPNQWTQTQKIESGKAVQLGGDGILLTSDFVYSQNENGNFVPMDQENLTFSQVYNVAISGNMVAIGEPNHDSTGVVTIASTAALADATLAPVSPPFSRSPTPEPVPSEPTRLATNPPTGSFWPKNSEWHAVQELTTSDGMSKDEFGYSVAINGETLVAGSHLHIVDGAKAGAAYVFELVNGSWKETQKLVSDDPDDSDYFARTVAIHGNQIAIGAKLDDSTRGDYGSGRVYVFLKDDSTGSWSQTQVLEDLYGDTNANFGDAVAMNDNFLLVGEPGVRQAHVYGRIGDGEWELSKTFLPDRPALEQFGLAVAISGRTAAVGAPSGHPHYRPGFVMIYTITGDGGWSSGFKLQPSDSSNWDNFGHSVAIEGTTLVVRAKESTYIFELSEVNDQTSWTQIQKIDEAGPIAIDGNYLLVGQTMYAKLANGVWRLQQDAELVRTQESTSIYTVDISEHFAILGHPSSNDKTGMVSVYQNFIQPTESPSLTPPTGQPTDPPSYRPSSLAALSIPTLIPFTSDETTSGTGVPKKVDTKAPSSDGGTPKTIEDRSTAPAGVLSVFRLLVIIQLFLQFGYHF